ncbi:hypothetical protein [Paenibacillus sp. S02]|uniref:hypothetical protein n=1 Tax=Paenibacillus sp. S02 TaxID=2823904 RepID=UPI001C649F14|nr:hypothetical protein [Paenibacillus sp. S02]QYK68273.1 hypothetical protein KAI36_03424 [Paenibacillus sp. S02]
MSEKVDINKGAKVKITFRLIIVLFTWVVTFTKPDSESAFFTVLFVSSVTSLYEYVIIYLETNESVRSIISVVGTWISALYGVMSLGGFFGFVKLDIKSLVFSLGEKVPMPHPEQIVFDYYYIVPWMLIFPFLVCVEYFLKPDKVAAVKSAQQKVV